MVDIEQDGVEELAWISRLEARQVSVSKGQCKEVAVNELASLITRERLPEWNQALLMPLNDGCQIVDDKEPAHRWIFERLDGSVAKSKPTNDDVKVVTVWKRFRRSGKPETGERLFHFSKQARHQECVPKDNLVKLPVFQ